MCWSDAWAPAPLPAYVLGPSAMFWDHQHGAVLCIDEEQVGRHRAGQPAYLCCPSRSLRAYATWECTKSDAVPAFCFWGNAFCALHNPMLSSMNLARHKHFVCGSVCLSLSHLSYQQQPRNYR